jgi:heat shock protein 1/8
LQSDDEHKCPAVGIDLGTTQSCVAVLESGGIQVIANEDGYNTTTSCVEFLPHTALPIIWSNPNFFSDGHPRNAIRFVKRLIGRRYDEPCVRTDEKTLQYSITSANNKIKIKVERDGCTAKLYSPEEISAMVLMKMKMIASRYLKKEVIRAVITVPAYFNNSQRGATKDAAEIAGLEVLRIINEPTAAAIAFVFKKHKLSIEDFVRSNGENILVFDVGGGTFDISVVSFSGGHIQVIATDGNTHLGGIDFDNVIILHCISEFMQQNGLKNDIKIDPKKNAELRLRCEEAKKKLSASCERAMIQVSNFYDGKELLINFRKSLFEAKIGLLCDKIIYEVNKVLRRIKPIEIDDVILVGGTSRIPTLQKVLLHYLRETKIKQLNTMLNADEAVAQGAAVYAAVISKVINFEAGNQGIIVSNSLPMSLGFKDANGVIRKILKRDYSVPTYEEDIATTVQDNQTNVEIMVFEGEREFHTNCSLLAKFTLRGIKPAKRGVPKIKVEFNVDSDGILTVTATDVTPASDTTVKESRKLTVINDSGRLTKIEIQQHKREIEELFLGKHEPVALPDEMLEDFIVTMEGKATASPDISAKKRSALLTEIGVVSKWRREQGTIISMDDYLTKKKQLEDTYQNSLSVMEIIS